MVSNSKVIYLQKKDGKSIKAHVVSFLKDQTTDKMYVIVANQNGKNVKGYEIVENQAVILSALESGIFKGYKSNPNFLDITNQFEDGIHLELVKEAKKEEVLDVVYYVFDTDVLNAYKASLSTSNILSDIRFLKSWENVSEEDIPKIVNENQYPEPAFVIYDKASDLEYGSNGEVTPLRWTAVSDIPYESDSKVVDLSIEDQLEVPRTEQEEDSEFVKNNNAEGIMDDIENNFEGYIEDVYTAGLEESEEIIIEGEPIIFYVYDQNVIKKYSALLTDRTEDSIVVKDIKTIEVVTGVEDLNLPYFLAREEIELGSYFVNYDDYNPTIENINGKLIAVATLKNALCKTEEMAEQAFAEEPQIETEEIPTKVLVFNGDIDVYDNQTHYTIWGCFCTLVSEEPFIIIPDKNGVKTVIYEDEEASSISEVCQNYQNLYPNVSVYLTNNEIKGNDAITIEEYTVFKPQASKKNSTLLEKGRKVLTEEEMIAKRQAELETLKQNGI